MSPIAFLDRFGSIVSQTAAQCQFWCLLGCLAVGLALFVAAGVAALQVIEFVDGADAWKTLRH